MGQVIPFPNRRRGVLWMTLDELELHAAEAKVNHALSELHLLRLQQFQQFFTQQKTSRGEWQ